MPNLSNITLTKDMMYPLAGVPLPVPVDVVLVSRKIVVLRIP
jgi:hypothetical protein